LKFIYPFQIIKLVFVKLTENKYIIEIRGKKNGHNLFIADIFQLWYSNRSSKVNKIDDNKYIYICVHVFTKWSRYNN
jgi:uncharacterized protein with NRDE domain